MKTMTRIDGIKLFFYKILDFLTLFQFFNKIALVFLVSKNIYRVEFWRYREYNRPDTTSYLFFSNGLVLPRPQGEMQYFIIQGKRIGSAFVYDNMSLWNLNFKDTDKMLEIISNSAIDKATIVEIAHEINRATSSEEDIKAVQMTGLFITAFMFILVLVVSYLIFSSVNSYWQGISGIMKDFAEIKKLEHQEMRMKAYEFANTYNVSIPELGIYYDPVIKKAVFKNDTQNIPMPNLPTGPQLPNLPVIPSGG